MLVEGLQLTDEEFVVRRTLWNIGGKLRSPWRELVCEDAGILERECFARRESGETRGTWPGEVECYGRGNLWGKLEDLGEHARVEGSVGEFVT